MSELTKLLLRASEIRQRLNELGAAEDLNDEQRSEIDTLTVEYRSTETKIRALRVAAEPGDDPDSEARELQRLEERVGVADYIGAAIEMRSVDGAAREYNAALEMGADRFPLRLLAPTEAEIRATTNAEGQSNQGTWLDRLFHEQAAMRVGVSMRSVPAGVASYPVTTAGATGEQQDRSEATSDAAWTVGVTECKPKRGSVRAVFNIEDAARLPGLESALRRDLQMALVDHVDESIFLGDDGPSTAAYDIVGLNTATGVTEGTITQAHKVDAFQTIGRFAAMIDGLHARDLMDLGIVAAVGAGRLWTSTQANASRNETVAQIMMGNGLSWKTRGGIETATADGDLAAFVGRMRGIDGAAVAAMWEAGSLIRDPYSKAAEGEVAITINYLWDFQIPRPANFRRLAFAA